VGGLGRSFFMHGAIRKIVDKLAEQTVPRSTWWGLDNTIRAGTHVRSDLTLSCGVYCHKQALR